VDEQQDPTSPLVVLATALPRAALGVTAAGVSGALGLLSAAAGLLASGARGVAQVEDLVERLSGAVARLDALLDTSETLAGRITAVVDHAEQVATAVDATVDRAGVTVADLRPVVTLLDESFLGDAAAAVRQLPAALGNLEALVPVVDRLSANVDSLNTVVADVGALLTGIPGSARLVRRGEREPRPGRPGPGTGQVRRNG
jgi:hypothetical protein